MALVDTHGKIVFIGHPATRKLEEDIDKLLKGEKITGEGTGASSSGEGGALEGLKDLNLSDINAEIAKF